MTDKDILKGNKLIADFMEYKRYDGFNDYFQHGDYSIPTMRYYKYSRQQEENIEVDSYSLNRLKFHSSWDWLMPVVSKIASIELTDGDTKNLRYLCVNYLSVFDIHIEHKAVVEFIKWYNNKINK